MKSTYVIAKTSIVSSNAEHFLFTKKTGHLPNELLKTDHCVCEAATAGRANKAHSCLASPA